MPAPPKMLRHMTTVSDMHNKIFPFILFIFLLPLFCADGFNIHTILYIRHIFGKKKRIYADLRLYIRIFFNILPVFQVKKALRKFRKANAGPDSLIHNLAPERIGCRGRTADTALSFHGNRLSPFPRD